MSSELDLDELKVTEGSPKILVSQEEAVSESPSCSDETPVVLPPFAEEQGKGKQVKCSSTAEEIETQPASHRAALFSFMSTNGAGDNFKHIPTQQAYKEESTDFISSCRADGVQTQILVLVLTSDEVGQPVIGGEVVSESNLYGPLNSCLADAASRAVVLQFHCRMEGSSASSDKSATEKAKTKTNSRRASYCGLEVYRFDIQSGANLLKLHKYLSQVFDDSQAQGTVASGEEISRRIAEHCPSPVKLITASGFPCAELSQTTPPDPEVPGIPIVAGDLEDASNSLKELSSRTPIECNKRNVACGFVIQLYHDGHLHRGGAEKDVEHITETARLLGCHPKNIHVLNDEHGVSSREKILNHIRETLERYDGKVGVKNLFLFVSAHGSKAGFTLPHGDTIRIEEVVQPFLSIAEFVLLFYQACRGTKNHSADRIRLESAPFVAGVSVDSPDVSGCCLPSSLENCAAIFASQCGYVAYRNDNEGSRMLKALRHVASSLKEPVSVRKLAHLVQARIHVTTPQQGGRVCQWSERKCKGVNSFVQLQYSVNGSGQLLKLHDTE